MKNVNGKAKKIYAGLYWYKGLYISVSYGTISNWWNIYTDEDLINEYCTGFSTKKEAINFIDLHK